MDIYMPLRFQHQIEETMKQCLPKKGKFMLALTTNQMTDHLRKRMFTDIKTDQMMDKCLKVVRELKLDADILTIQNLKHADEEFKKHTMAELERKKIENPVLARIEEQTKGDADSEALGKLQEQMEEQVESQLRDLKDEVVKTLTQANEKMASELEQSMSKSWRQIESLQTFQNTLKEEIDQANDLYRHQSFESLNLIKSLSNGQKKLKEQGYTVKEEILSIKELLSMAVNHQGLLQKLLSPEADYEKGSVFTSVRGSSLLQSQGHHNISVASINQSTSEGVKTDSNLVRKAGEILKKLNVAMFRNTHSSNVKNLSLGEQSVNSLTNLINKSALTSIAEHNQDSREKSHDFGSGIKPKYNSTMKKTHKTHRPSGVNRSMDIDAIVDTNFDNDSLFDHQPIAASSSRKQVNKRLAPI